MNRTLCLVASLFAVALVAQTAPAQDLRQLSQRPKVREQLAAVPQLDSRLADLDKALGAVEDQTSITTTTARYILGITREAEAIPEAFDFRMPDASASPSMPASPSKKYADYVSLLAFSMDFAAELTRAEKLAVDARAGRDPLAGVKGDVHLAYRSDLDGMLMPYRIYVPTTYDKTRKYPLIVLLHAAACDENTLMMANAFQPIAEERGYLIASVNGRGPYSDFRKENGAQKDLFDVIALMEKYYNVDKDHIFLTGASMGGAGTWNIGFEFRSEFAALASMAGTGTQTMSYIQDKLTSGKKIPVLITMGGKDKLVPVEPAIEVYKKVREAGYPTKIVVYPEDSHFDVFKSSVPDVFAWFDQYRKEMP